MLKGLITEYKLFRYFIAASRNLFEKLETLIENFCMLSTNSVAILSVLGALMFGCTFIAYWIYSNVVGSISSSPSTECSNKGRQVHIC